MKFVLTFALCFILFSNGNVFADNNPQSQSSLPYLTVPNIYSGSTAGASFIGPITNTPRTNQFLIHENQLTALVGQYIDGITWRLPVSVTTAWPPTAITFTNYDIYLSESVPPSQRSLIFAENIVGPQTQVRAGQLTIPAESFPGGSNPNGFGHDIMFDSLYLYTGGHLLIELRHSGSSGGSRTVEAAGTATTGYGTDFSGCWVGSYTGTTGMQANFCVTRLSSIITGISNSTEFPNAFQLKQNYPNPFNPVTKIQFNLPSSGNVKFRIYDMKGTEINYLINGIMTAGNHEVIWDAAAFASGAYFYRLEFENIVATRKMLLIR